MDEAKRRALAGNLAEVREEIAAAARAAGRDLTDITLVAVSKKHDAEAVRALALSGQRAFGESYVQEALEKQQALEDIDVSWHFIGGLQTNKAKFVVGAFDLVHSVDKPKLARTLHNRAEAAGVVQDVLVQVNLAGETQKRGAGEEEAMRLAEKVLSLDALRLRGLMVMPPFFDDPEASRPYFAGLRRLAETIRQRLRVDLPHLSMGMTNDFVQAVAEGATIVRVGTRIFGPRPY